MFNINGFFENFSDRPGYDELYMKLEKATELVFNGTFTKIKNFSLPNYDVKTELNDFPKELEKLSWDHSDIELVKVGINIYKNKDLSDDIEAFSLCMLRQALFPAPPELFDLIIDDLEKGTDNRSKYVELFDLHSDIVNSILYYMS